MERKEFKVTINAPREKVWKTLWDDTTYREWTSAFAEGSHAVTDWAKDSKVLFLDAKGQGMVSEVAENLPNEYMSFRHLGEVKDGIEDTESEQVKAWAGATENYTLKDAGGDTEVTVDMALPPEHMEYFMTTWPKALDKLKAAAER